MMPFDMENFNYESEKRHESSAALLNLREQLADEMSDAINEGDANQMLLIHKQLETIGARLFSAEIVELKNAIKADELRKIELTNEIKMLVQEKSSRNKKLGRAIMLQQRRQAMVARAELAVQFGETDLANLRDSINAKQSKLESLKMAKMEEMN